MKSSAGQELICSGSGVSGAVLTYTDNLGPSKVSGCKIPTMHGMTRARCLAASTRRQRTHLGLMGCLR